MSSSQVFEQVIQISAPVPVVERCITELDLMHRWLNPLLSCEPVGEWSTAIGSPSRFVIQIPWLYPTLENVVVEQGPGLIVWEFDGFFQGRDRWECQPIPQGTDLLNRFEFTIPNPLIRFGFHLFAANFTKADMKSQLQRLKHLAEKHEARFLDRDMMLGQDQKQP